MSTQLETLTEKESPSDVWKKYRGHVANHYMEQGCSWGVAFEQADREAFKACAQTVLEDVREALRFEMLVTRATVSRVIDKLKNNLGD